MRVFCLTIDSYATTTLLLQKVQKENQESKFSEETRLL